MKERERTIDAENLFPDSLVGTRSICFLNLTLERDKGHELCKRMGEKKRRLGIKIRTIRPAKSYENQGCGNLNTLVCGCSSLLKQQKHWPLIIRKRIRRIWK